MKEIKSQQDAEAAVQSGAKVRVVEAPTYHASTIRMSLESNDCTITFSRSRPALIEGPNIRPAEAAVSEAVATVYMSPQTAKDLLLLLQEQIARYENEWGSMETAFSRRRSGQSGNA